MDANAFRQLFEYHFAENRKIWDHNVVPLSQEDFVQEVAYSRGSVRNQMVHLMNAENYWFSGLSGGPWAEDVDPATMSDRAAIRARWDEVEQGIRGYLAGLTDEMLDKHPLKRALTRR